MEYTIENFKDDIDNLKKSFEYTDFIYDIFGEGRITDIFDEMFHTMYEMVCSRFENIEHARELLWHFCTEDDIDLEALKEYDTIEKSFDYLT